MGFCSFLHLFYICFCSVFGYDKEHIQMMELQIMQQAKMMQQLQAIVDYQVVRLDFQGKQLANQGEELALLREKVLYQDVVIKQRSGELERLGRITSRQSKTILRQSVDIKHMSGQVDRCIQKSANEMKRAITIDNKKLDTTSGRPPNVKEEHLNGTTAAEIESNRCDRSVTTKVAFYAYLSTTHKNPGNGHVIIFDYVHLNSGSGYNTYSGAFTAPEDGYYVFSYTIVTFPSNRVPVEFVCNGDVIGSTAADSDIDTVYPSVTNTLVTYLYQTHTCLLRTSTITKWGPVGDVYSSAWSRSSISGWKL